MPSLASPAELIQTLFASNPSLDGFESRVASAFLARYGDDATRSQVPAITSLSTAATLPQSGTLVRFRAMVQDTGVGSEVYKAVGSDGSVLMFGMEEMDESAAGVEDYSNLQERQVLYLVSVPGETDWVVETLDEATSSVINLSVSDAAAKASPPNLLAAKIPVPSKPHFGCIAKVYGEAGEKLKIGDVRDFFGVISETSITSPFDDLVNDEAPPVATTATALHVVFDVPAAQPSPAFSSSSDFEATRKALINYLAEAVGGDVDAAEWVLLALLGRIHTRHLSGLTLGSLSVNLALPTNLTATPLSSILASILAKTTSLDLSIPFLNSPSTKMAPRSRNENLESGALQLSAGTTVLVDTRGIGEGKLEDAGVRNLQHLTTTIATQKLAYEFPYSSFELDTDLGFVILSEGKALIPLSAFRSFLATQKDAEFLPLPADMSEVIQGDYVKRRAASVGGEAMTQEDLLFRMGASRLLALSHGKSALDEEVWLAMAELDERRKEAFPLVKK
ncbi:hypothetical protein RQP46_000679 [Phenoliferia psychrophenolica]